MSLLVVAISASLLACPIAHGGVGVHGPTHARLVELAGSGGEEHDYRNHAVLSDGRRWILYFLRDNTRMVLLDSATGTSRLLDPGCAAADSTRRAFLLLCGRKRRPRLLFPRTGRLIRLRAVHADDDIDSIGRYWIAGVLDEAPPDCPNPEDKCESAPQGVFINWRTGRRFVCPPETDLPYWRAHDCDYDLDRPRLINDREDRLNLAGRRGQVRLFDYGKGVTLTWPGHERILYPHYFKCDAALAGTFAIWSTCVRGGRSTIYAYRLLHGPKVRWTVTGIPQWRPFVDTFDGPDLEIATTRYEMFALVLAGLRRSRGAVMHATHYLLYELPLPG